MIIANIISIRPHVVVTSAFSLRQQRHQQQKHIIINNIMKKKKNRIGIGGYGCGGGGSSSSGSFAVASSRMMHYYSSSSSTSLSTRLGMTSSRRSDTEISTDNDETAQQQQQQQEQNQEQESENTLLHPDDFGPIPHPKHLSPSSAMAFKECPQSFLFQYLYKIKQPTNHVLAKGSMCHSALEHIFDLEPKDRTIENLHNMLRVEWAENRLEDEYRFLFERENEENQEGDDIINNNNNNNSNENDGSSSSSNIERERDIEAEIEWGQSALQLLDNYYRSEDPRTIQRPNPHKREVWVSANLSIDPTVGVTAANANTNNNDNNNDSLQQQQQQQQQAAEESSFKVRGIIDRIDMVRESSRQVALKIIDYKSGKAPNLKYSPSMNQHIFQKNFYQLKIYALLLREKNAAAGTSAKNNEMELRYLKLHYLNSVNGRAKPWEMDLGETQDIRDAELNEVHRDLSQIWMDISSLVQTQDPNAFIGCDRSFCFCHVCRDRFVPGTVWEKPSK